MNRATGMLVLRVSWLFRPLAGCGRICDINDIVGSAHLRRGTDSVPHPESAIDKQIAATALTHGLTLVTRN